jgi:Holliday junction DNA helicase RuvB
VIDEDDALTKAEEAELARRARGARANTADQEREPPETYSAPQAPSRGLAPGEGAMGEGLLHDLGGPRGDHAPGGGSDLGGPRGDHSPGGGIVSPLADGDERAIEGALRPKRLDDFVGQARVREQLTLLLHSALRRGRPPDHVLLSGPPGLGKTTIAMIIAAELGAPLRITSGPAIERSGDLAAVLSTLQEGEVVFIDEIHRLARPAEEMLYLAMEDFRVDIIVGKGPGATAIPLDIAPFTLVGATTRAGLLPAPLRDRFGFTAHLDFYQPEELAIIVRRSAGLLGVRIEDGGIEELAQRSRGTPRIANRLLRRVRDYAEVRADGLVTKELTKTALELYEVDELGLDRLDRAVLDALIRRFGGGPVGLSTLAVAVAEEAETVEVVAEPFLVRHGLLARTPRGRVATRAGWEHLGLVPPPPADTPTLFD